MDNNTSQSLGGLQLSARLLRVVTTISRPSEHWHTFDTNQKAAKSRPVYLWQGHNGVVLKLLTDSQNFALSLCAYLVSFSESGHINVYVHYV